MRVSRMLLLGGLALMAADSALAQVNAYQAWEDAHVIRRVATVAGKGMPEELLTKMSHGIVEELRGKQPGGKYLYAYFTREEAGTKSDSFGLKPKKGDAPAASVELRGTRGYRVRLAVPSRRYLVARNRGIEVDRAVVDYTNERGDRRTEEFPLAAKLAPGEHTEFDLEEIGWNPVVRVWAWADERIGKNASLEIIIKEPKLVDDPKSPYHAAVMEALRLPKAIDREDSGEVRRLCDSISAGVERVAPDAAAEARNMATPAGSSIDVSATTSAPSRADTELHGQLQRIEDLLTGSEAERREGMDRLHQVIRSLRP